MNVDQIAVPANKGDLVAVLLAGEPDETVTVTLHPPVGSGLNGMVMSTIRFGTGLWSITNDTDSEFSVVSSWHDHANEAEASECMHAKTEAFLTGGPSRVARLMGATFTSDKTGKEAPEGVISPAYPHGWSSV